MMTVRKGVALGSALGLTAVLAVLGAAPAQAGTTGETNCKFYLKAPDNTLTPGPVSVTLNWRRSDGGSYLATRVNIYNGTGRGITLSTDRWQSSDASIVNRGPATSIASGQSEIWWPTSWIAGSLDPYANIAAYATTRTGMSGYTHCRPSG